MKIVLENNEIVGAGSINKFLKALSNVLNEHFVASGNKIDMKVPKQHHVDDGMYNAKVTVEFGTKPYETFEENNSAV